VNRAATFVFFIGNRFFGAPTAFVPGVGRCRLWIHERFGGPGFEGSRAAIDTPDDGYIGPTGAQS
jgi:hypothetical protein